MRQERQYDVPYPRRASFPRKKLKQFSVAIERHFHVRRERFLCCSPSLVRGRLRRIIRFGCGRAPQRTRGQALRFPRRNPRKHTPAVAFLHLGDVVQYNRQMACVHPAPEGIGSKIKQNTNYQEEQKRSIFARTVWVPTSSSRATSRASPSPWP